MQQIMGSECSSRFPPLTEAELRKVLNDMHLWEGCVSKGNTARLIRDLDLSIADLHGMSDDAVPLGSLDPSRMSRS